MVQRHRARPVAALLVALLTGLLTPLLTAPAAHAASTSVSMGDGVLYDRCHRYQYRYSVDPGDYYTWDAEVTFRRPDGRKAATDYLHGDSNADSGTRKVLLCGGIDPAGRYKVTLDVTYEDEDYEEIGSAQAVDRAKLRKPNTRTSYTVSDQTPTWHQILTFRIRSKIEAPKGYVPNRYEYVALEARRGGVWKRIPGSKERVGGRGVAKMKARWERRDPLAIRAVTLNNKAFDGSASKAKTLG